MFTEGIYPIGDGLLDIDEERLKALLVPHDINDIYDVEQTPFARGKFAAVRRAIHKHSGVHFAAKFLKRRRRAQSSDKEIKHEIAVLKLCEEAENIVKLNAVHESRSDTALLLELATGGELQTFLDNEECLNETQARICMREVLKALQFLHKRSIVHLDLKPQNILLSGERIEDGLKLCDFGISRVVAEGTNVREIVGTPDYVAPEVLQYEPLSLMTDIWSVGVLAYVLLSGFSPFGGETKQETFLNISQCALTFPDKLFGGVSSAAIDFIRRALRIKASDRMTAAQCLEHIWLKDECSIDRQIFTNFSKRITRDYVEESDDEGEAHDHHEHDEEELKDNEGEDNSLVTPNDDDDTPSTEDNNVGNGMKTEALQKIVPINSGNGNGMVISESSSLNGKRSRLTVATNPISPTITKTTATTTTTTTAIVNLPAQRATTIPLSSNRQQNMLIASRRHSSDHNKENTFLTTKNILPNHCMKSGSTSVIILTSNGIESCSITTAKDSPKMMTSITLPTEMDSSGGYVGQSTSAMQCLFPDAPTTPKVIRKAPSTEGSQTSVKALVRKFQFESTKNESSPEAATTDLRQQKPSLPWESNGGASNGSSFPLKSAGRNINKDEMKLMQKMVNFHHNNTMPTGNTSTCLSSATSRSSLGNTRRASEPTSIVHIKALSTKPSFPLSCKSICVLCLKCNGHSTIECRHSSIETSNSNSSSTNDCRDRVNDGNSSSNLCNTSTSPTSPTSPTSSTSSATATASVSASAAAAAAAAATTLLLCNHKQIKQQPKQPHAHRAHNHHNVVHMSHHHAVPKTSASNNLNLDQGIIC